jgi:hypothetical protein
VSPSPGFDYSIRKGGAWGCFLDSHLLLPSFTRIACSLCPLPLLGIHLRPSHYSIVIMLCTEAVVIVIVIVFGFASSVSKLYDVLVLGRKVCQFRCGNWESASGDPGLSDEGSEEAHRLKSHRRFGNDALD